ncbi:UbiA family prenyltransferase [Paludisphaera soli]|uniref:UbiA family prenyltransferase n=1 Tax=Paludisphaera soli TaxID=2712865 RepID=UPI0013EA54DC|nr:UbiA family prenyltransferase [Paludisphaera soli]
METIAAERDRPLCVDLDGTLIATDLLWESYFALARSRPTALLLSPAWLLKGRSRLKSEIADRVVLDIGTLPYREAVVDFLKAEKARGRRIVLATASDRRFAQAVADHLGLFDEVIASDAGENLKGLTKLAALEARFGRGGFAYLGDSTADLPIWEGAGETLLVDSQPGVVRRASAFREPSRVFEGTRVGPRALIKALRPHQWAKNILLFVALMASHRFFDLASWLSCLTAFAAFSAAASAVYILNDLLDLESDRKHSRKRRRPFASGAAPIPIGVVMIGALLAASAVAAAFLPARFGALLVLYLVLTTLYSVYLKRRLMVDVICLAGLYTLRILAGGEAASVIISPWLMAFSMFLFLSLAFAKRYAELTGASESGGKIAGRGYWPSDVDLIRSFGPISGYLCVLVFCLYLNSPDVRLYYRRPDLLWLMCPILLYWISRVWFLACREQLADDPVVFALRDRNSHACGLLFAAI